MKRVRHLVMMRRVVHFELIHTALLSASAAGMGLFFVLKWPAFPAAVRLGQMVVFIHEGVKNEQISAF